MQSDEGDRTFECPEVAAGEEFLGDRKAKRAQHKRQIGVCDVIHAEILIRDLIHLPSAMTRKTRPAHWIREDGGTRVLVHHADGYAKYTGRHGIDHRGHGVGGIQSQILSGR